MEDVLPGESTVEVFTGFARSGSRRQIEIQDKKNMEIISRIF